MTLGRSILLEARLGCGIFRQDGVAESPVLQIGGGVDVHAVEPATHCMFTVQIIRRAYLQNVAAVRMDGVACGIEPVGTVGYRDTCCACSLRMKSKQGERECKDQKPDGFPVTHYIHLPKDIRLNVALSFIL